MLKKSPFTEVKTMNMNKKQKMAARILCIVLAALMVGGVAFQVIGSLLWYYMDKLKKDATAKHPFSLCDYLERID